MTSNEWLAQAQSEIQALGIASAALDAQLILAHVFGVDRTHVLAHDDQALSPQEIEQANKLLKRRKNNEPMAFLLGTKEFYGLPFKTDKRALIPRWETETIVEASLAYLHERKKPATVLEIGTGCGVIAVTLAHTAPDHTYIATELSQDALALAYENAKLAATLISFLQGDLGQPALPAYAGNVDLLVANLPYIPEPLLETLDPTVTYHEPHLALSGGEDGLELYRQFMPQAKELLAPNGLLLCEHEFDQGEAMRTLAKQHFPAATIQTLQDGLHHDRVLSVQL